MFGGLKQFLLQRRALNQDTEDREFLAKQRDLALKGGQQGLDLGAVRLGRDRFAAERDPIMAAQGDARFVGDLAGPAALQSALSADPNQMFGSGFTAKSMMPGVARQIAREDVADRTATAAARGAEGNASLVENRVNALEEVTNNPSLDPTTSRAALTTFNRAGLSGAPTFGQTQEAALALQNDQQSHAAGMLDLSQRFSREMADRTVPLGVNPSVDHNIMQALEQYARTTEQLRREVSIIDHQIAENEGRKRTAITQMGVEGSAPVVDGAAASNQAFEKQRMQKLSQIYAQGDEIDRTIKGMFGNNQAALDHYRRLINSIRMGTTPQAAPSTVPGATTTPQPGTVRLSR